MAQRPEPSRPPPVAVLDAEALSVPRPEERHNPGGSHPSPLRCRRASPPPCPGDANQPTHRRTCRPPPRSAPARLRPRRLSGAREGLLVRFAAMKHGLVGREELQFPVSQGAAMEPGLVGREEMGRGANGPRRRVAATEPDLVGREEPHPERPSMTQAPRRNGARPRRPGGGKPQALAGRLRKAAMEPGLVGREERRPRARSSGPLPAAMEPRPRRPGGDAPRMSARVTPPQWSPASSAGRSPSGVPKPPASPPQWSPGLVGREEQPALPCGISHARRNGARPRRPGGDEPGPAGAVRADAAMEPGLVGRRRSS